MKEGYKKTELGWIPEEWNINILSDISEKIFVGIATSTSEFYTEDGIVIIRNQNIKEDRLFKEDLLKITNEFSELNKSKQLKYGDILTVRTGYPGTSCVVTSEFEGSHTFTTLITRPNKEKINPFYLSRYFNSDIGRKIFNSGKAGGAQQNLGVKFLEGIKVIIPPLKEQQKIAEILSTVDSQLYDTEKLIEKTNELKNGLMQRLLTKGIGHKEFKKTEFGEIPVGWAVNNLDKLVDICYGKSQKEIEVSYGKYRILGTGGIIGYTNSFLWDKPSVLIGRKGTIDKPQYIDEPFWTVDTLFYTKVKDSNLAKWLFYYMNNIDLKKYNEATGVPSLSISNLNNIRIATPSIEEQNQIANILSSVDSQIEEYENKKAKLEELKKGLMQKLLTGKIRVV